VDSVNVFFISEDNELAKIVDPNSPVVGLDDLGNVLIGNGELSLIRGGWKDRNGVYYEDGIVSGKPCSVNITIKGTSNNSVNARIFQDSMSKIVNK
jgi:hypothetical protein